MPDEPGKLRKARFGPFEVDFRAGELLKSGRKIRLQDQPLQVLAILIESRGEVVTRDELRQKLWPGDTFVDFDHGLNNAINRLREALNDSAENPRFIETLPRRGYRFIGEMDNEVAPEVGTEAVAGTVDPRVTDEPSSPTTLETEENEKPPPAQPIHHGIKPWLVMGATAGCVVTLVLILLGYKHLLGSSAAMRIESVAVLPLENLSGDPSQDYFADGMTDALTTSLAQLRGIRVISRTSAVNYKNTKQKLPEIAKELGVDAVVEGSTSRSNGVVRVNAQLIYAPGDRHIWARAYEGPSSNLSRMENEIANDIAVRLGTGAGLASDTYSLKTLAVNPEAYDLYLRAASYYGLERREANDQAVQLLEKSVELDPQFAAAYASLATAYRVRAFSVEINEPKWIEKANAAVAKSLSLDPKLAEGYVSRGYLLWSRANDWAVERAVADYRHALDLNPNLAEAHHQLANVYNHVGLLDKADEEIKKAVALDPLNTGIRFRVGISFLYQGKYEEALAEMRDSEKFLPALWTFQTSFALQHLERRQEAEERLSRMLKTMPNDPGGSLTSMQALLAADAGDIPSAERKIQEAVIRGKGYQHFHHVAYAIASAYALMNKHGESLQYLRMAADDGFPCYPLFEHDANLDRLRDDPRFSVLLIEQRKQWEYFREHL
jgi:TolB-like protein/DNA-binding winged helix-turn-helix (wHTH) protein/tetratricopeptide (TPR) repeat protein